MKKVFTFLLILLVCFTFSFGNISYAFAQKINDSYEFKSHIVYSLDEVGQKLSESNQHKQVKIKIKNIAITLNSIEIGGSILDGDIETPLAITGELFRSSNSDKRVIGRLSDKTGNYNVVHFSIDGEPSTSFFFNKSLGKAEENVLTLYLIDKNRNFIYIEIENPIFIQHTLYSGNFNSAELEKADTIEELWYAKIIKPVNKDVKSDNDNLVDDSLNAITPYAVIPVSFIRTYTYSYNVGGVTVNEVFRVKHYLSVPESITNQGEWTAQLSVESEWTTANYPGFDSSDTNFHIGWYGGYSYSCIYRSRRCF